MGVGGPGVSAELIPGVSAPGGVSLDLGGAFHPTQLPGLIALYDISDLSTLFVERTGASASTPASVDGVVGTVLDLSESGFHLTAASDAARPLLKQDGSRYYALFDGTDDSLDLGSSSLFQNVPGATVVVGHKPGASMTTVGLFIASTSASMSTKFSNQILNGKYATAVRRTTASGATAAYSTNNHTTDAVVQSSIANVAEGGDGAVVVRVNGSEVRAAALSGTGNFEDVASARATLGSSLLSANTFFTGRIYAAAVFNKVLSASDLANVEQWVADKTGVTL